MPNARRLSSSQMRGRPSSSSKRPRRRASAVAGLPEVQPADTNQPHLTTTALDTPRRANPPRRARPPQYSQPAPRPAKTRALRTAVGQAKRATPKGLLKPPVAAKKQNQSNRSNKRQRSRQPAKTGNTGTNRLTAGLAALPFDQVQARSIQKERENTAEGFEAQAPTTGLRRGSNVPKEQLEAVERSEKSPSTDNESEMDSSSASRDQIENGSTLKQRSKQQTKISFEKLRVRLVIDEPADDKKLVELNKILKPRPQRQTLLRTAKEREAFVKELVKSTLRNSEGSEYSFLDQLALEIDRKKTEVDHPVANQFYFNAELKKCLSKNEAVLQRTIMMSTFHNYWLSPEFDWNAEGQWKEPMSKRLPSNKLEDLITLPKPDLAMSFTLRSLAKDEDCGDPIPEDLMECLSPDGGKRCFPFLFMEVKKATSDLQDAHLANLHNAAQALYNIYHWMAFAEMTEECFKNVRVFSFVFNAQDLEVRVHRVDRRGDNRLVFRFAELTGMVRYSRDLACGLLNSILKEYAAKELHGILLKAYRKVVTEEERTVDLKRKPTDNTNPTQKRSRSSRDSSSSTGQSFVLDNTHI